VPIVATSLLALLALAGAGLDMASRRLPNWLCLVTALAGLAMAYAQGEIGALASPALHAALALIAGMVLFRFGWIGGGDAKFYAACAAWFPLASGLYLLGAVSLAGLVVITAWFGWRQLTRARTRGRGGAFSMVPYGLAVAIGAVALKVLSP
jgi:prepilin peptidase CpaA